MLIPSIIIVLGLSAIIFEQQALIRKVIFGLIGLSLISLTHLGFAEEDPQTMLLGVLSGIVIVGLIVGVALKKYGEWIALAGTLLAYILSSGEATYFGYELHFSGTLLLLPFLGALGPILVNVKAGFLGKWFGLDVSKTTRAANVFYAALMVFFGMFEAQYFGVILVATGWLAVGLATRKFHATGGAIALLSLGFLFILMKTAPSVDDSFLRGNFLMGLVAGLGAMAWVMIAKDAAKLRWILMFLIPLAVVTALILMGKANENFGGIPAYIGALFGSSIGLLAFPGEKHTIPFQALLIGISGFILTQFAPIEAPKKQSRLETTAAPVAKPEEKPDVLAVPAIPADAKLAGNWKSALEASKVEFQLGPEGGVTNGVVEDFTVKLKMSATGEPEQLSVQMPTVKVSTLNPMRDESVHGAAYLNAAAFPKMGFKSTAIKKDGDHYLVSGNFEMLGKKAPLELLIKFAATGSDKGKNFLVMVGKSKLDRTQFGMKSDSKIGDLVDVTFEVEFRK